MSTQGKNLNVEGILSVAQSLFPDISGKGSSNEIEEIKLLDKKLLEGQKRRFREMLEHIKESKNPNTLINAATGFGKSFFETAFAGILKHAKIDYRIVVPDNLVQQLKKDVNALFSGETAEEIKSKIKGHKEFFIDKWKEETSNLSKSTFLMIDEVDLATQEDLHRQRFKLLESENPCISLSATPQKWLYNHTIETGGKIISVSLEEKIREMGIILAHSINAIASSVMKRTNKRSGFLPYACIVVTSYLLILLFKIYLNSYTIKGFVHLSTLYNFYNFYLNTFIYHPIIGQISLITVAYPIISLINLIVNKMANRDISGRLIANLTDTGASSPAHEDVCKTEETFFITKISSTNDLNIQSPRGKKSLILACNYDVIRNLSLIYRDERNEVYKNGKLLSLSKAHDQYKLGKDFCEKCDFSYKESQRNYCITQLKKEIRKNNCYLKRDQIDEIVNKIDFSDTSTYSEYRVMHGIINSALLALLQKCYDDQGKKNMITLLH